MITGKFISNDRIELARARRDSSRQVESSRVMIEDSKKVLVSLKNASLELKYYVECSHDYLKNSPTSTLSTESRGVLLYFNQAVIGQAVNE